MLSISVLLILSLSLVTARNVLLNFDDIRPNCSQPYFQPTHGLEFSPSLSVFNPSAPCVAHLITPQDRNCAVSSPNALLGSVNAAGRPAFVVRDASRTFTLISFWIKPLAYPEDGEVTLRVEASTSDGKRQWKAVYPEGWSDMFKAEFHWANVTSVTLWAEYGVQGLDWEFCLDDLVLGWEGGEENFGESESGQRVLGA